MGKMGYVVLVSVDKVIHHLIWDGTGVLSLGYSLPWELSLDKQGRFYFKHNLDARLSHKLVPHGPKIKTKLKMKVGGAARKTAWFMWNCGK